MKTSQKMRPFPFCNALLILSFFVAFFPPAISGIDESCKAGDGSQSCVSKSKPAKNKKKHVYTYPDFLTVSSQFPARDMGSCDPDVAYMKGCRPKKADCTEKIVDHFSHHGIGNALITTYSRRAAGIFDRGCKPKLVDENVKNVNKYGKSEDGTLFQLLSHVKVPEHVVNGSDMKCSIYTLTQPRKEARIIIDKLKDEWRDASDEILVKAGGMPQERKRGEKAPVPARPLVGVHIRTGWADETNRRFKGWDALGTCADYLDVYFSGTAGNRRLGPAGRGVRDGKNNLSLELLIADTVAASDEAFGENNYVVYVASDAPAVKRYIKDFYASEGSKVHVILHEGIMGHNAGKLSDKLQRTKEENLEVGRNSIVDLIMLSEATLLVHLSSKFPDAASHRNQCGQRTVKLRGHPRHGLDDVGSILERAFDRDSGLEPIGKDWVPNLDEKALNKLAELLPKGRLHECFEDVTPSRSCMCFFKLSHV
mmetsp:Transcript_12223/g.26719  ORF Transcript_12223/g.26719 Transcript_12223/m.26719 type:complete len:481 (-) Transcript_12223:137-1579(-)